MPMMKRHRQARELDDGQGDRIWPIVVRMLRFFAVISLSFATAVLGNTGQIGDVRPVARDEAVPNTRWTHHPDHVLWNRAALSALKTHGRALVEMVPGDIAGWCPAYGPASVTARRDFWVGFLSALAKHESTYKPRAVGGGGKWFGLLQILPATARGYQCNVGTGEALKSGSANLSCAVRIMAVTVPRDGVIHGRDSQWRGVSADWGPMRSEIKRAEMAEWLRSQPYCQRVRAIRPVARPTLPPAQVSRD
jgi:hypothetical protein